MAANIKTILIIGATSGIGEQFARRFHALGAKVILTGRRADRLSSLKSELGPSNVATYQWDVTDFANLSSRGSEIIDAHTEIDAVFLVSGVGFLFSFLDPSTITEEDILVECNTNVTAQMLLTRTFVPHLSAVAASGRRATFLITGSGLGIVPVGMFPVYCATKAAMHSLALALRQQVNQAKDENVKKNLAVVEVVPPFVDTDFAKDFKNPNLPQPMQLKDYMDETMAELEKTGEDGKMMKEVAAGSAKGRVALWRGSIGKHMNDLGLKC